MGQHCGNLDDHEQHEHTARKRATVTVCRCSARVCVCPGQEPRRFAPRVFLCRGTVVKEGAPPNMLVKVSL